MDFGEALHALKDGQAVSRRGWNGRGMFVYLVPEDRYPARTGIAKTFWGEGALVPYRAYFAIRTVGGEVATWSPSTSDCLADDWRIEEVGS